MKKLILGMAAAACIFTACKPSTGGDAAASMEKNKQAALNADMAFGKKNVDTAFKDYAPGFIDYGNGEGKPVKNIDTLKANMKSFLAAFPDFKGENIMAVADSNTVVVTGTWSGTFKGEFMKIKPTNKSFKASEAEIYTFNKDGKITSHKSTQSEVTYLYQLGVPMPPKK
jgi:predicted ester cyclase